MVILLLLLTYLAIYTLLFNGFIPQWTPLHIKPYPLKSRRKYLWFGPRDQGRRSASNYPIYGIVCTEKTKDYTMRQERAEYWLWTTAILFVFPFVVMVVCYIFSKRFRIWHETWSRSFEIPHNPQFKSHPDLTVSSYARSIVNHSGYRIGSTAKEPQARKRENILITRQVEGKLWEKL